GLYTLSDVTKRYISQLDKPVRVWMILPEGSESYRQTQSMLTELHDQNPKYFTYEEVSPSLNQSRLRELRQEVPEFSGPLGGLIVKYGDAKENYRFVSADRLMRVDMDFGAQSSGKQDYMGEIRLMEELYYLEGGKKKPNIYFTQGSGEPDLFDPQKGLAKLQRYLTESNYIVKPLQFDNPDAKVPDDADVVVVVGPQR